jgi:hypothetical protein
MLVICVNVYMAVFGLYKIVRYAINGGVEHVSNTNLRHKKCPISEEKFRPN